MKKTTLFRVLTFVLLIGLLASCSKHTDKPANPGGGNNGGGDNGGGTPPPTESYYVKTKMDGAALNYTGSVKAMRVVDEGTHMLQIQGIKGGGSTDEVDLLVYSAEDATAGEYTEGEHDTYFILGVYAPQNRADDLGIFYGGVHLDETAPFTIKITEMTDKYVKGTFSGTFYDNEGNGDNKKVFTEGEFKAPIQ
ncbi:hypothetical protein FC093_16595 [Ilyomonas limi]|uniref:Lipoprotein n=1 Tax=Ilyomonas limi TaxID=2575867 RepID=A0A4U3KY39_9BACT|nr:hypothetical protein [Ilyomonas limi]TKK66654.1 hypothetical protein FC093_16595 [Ilyomonas limi]